MFVVETSMGLDILYWSTLRPDFLDSVVSLTIELLLTEMLAANREDALVAILNAEFLQRGLLVGLSGSPLLSSTIEIRLEKEVFELNILQEE